MTNTSEKANGINRISDAIYMHAHTSPRLSGLDFHEQRRTQHKTLKITDIGVSYVFNKSRPLRFAFTNVGPRTGTRYAVARNANTEKPSAAWKAGRGGNGSRRGRTSNHAPTGTRERNSTVGIGRCESVWACAIAI